MRRLVDVGVLVGAWLSVACAGAPAPMHVGDARGAFSANHLNPKEYDIRIFRCYALDDDQLCFERTSPNAPDIFFGTLSLATPARRIPFAAKLNHEGLLMVFGRAENLFTTDHHELLYPGAATPWNRIYSAALFGEHLQLYESSDHCSSWRDWFNACPTRPGQLHRPWRAVSRKAFVETKGPGWPNHQG